MMRDVDWLIQNALIEDAPEGDVTSAFSIDFEEVGTAKILAKQAGVFFGEQVIEAAARSVDPVLRATEIVEDGTSVQHGDVVAELSGSVRSILFVERVMLNLIQRLSGVATRTRAFVDALDSPSIEVLDTRKTTPLHRFLERDAVRAGGGVNHRWGLSDMVLLKENHLRAIESSKGLKFLGDLIREYKEKNPRKLVEIEMETIDQLRTLGLDQVDIVLLDNFPLDALGDACAICRERAPSAKIEVSGNVTLETIAQYRDYDIDRISVGALTHSVPAFDFSLILV